MAFTEAVPDESEEIFLSLLSSSRRPLPAGGSTVLMTWPLLSTSTCLPLLPTAARFGELLLNGRRLFIDWVAAVEGDGDNNWCSDGPVVEAVRLKAAWKPVTAQTGGLKRLTRDEVATDVHRGWEPSVASVDRGRTAWPSVSNTRGIRRNVWTGGWLDTTAGCETTITGDIARLVITLPKQCGISDWEVDNAFTDDKTGDSDSFVLNSGSLVFFLAISSSNYRSQCQHKTACKQNLVPLHKHKKWLTNMQH